MRLPALSFAPLSFQYQILPFVVSELVSTGLLLVPSGLVSFLTFPSAPSNVSIPRGSFLSLFFCLFLLSWLGKNWIPSISSNCDAPRRLGLPYVPKSETLRILEPTHVLETAGPLQCSHSQSLSCN